LGLASCARGGDILFHEAMRRINLSTRIVLPFGPDDFIKTSVEGVHSAHWVDRFWSLWNSTPEKDRVVLNLPQDPCSFSLCNQKLLNLAKERGHFALLSLWNEVDSKRQGGASEMIAMAKKLTGDVWIVNPEKIK
jgi:hypothetical protein